MSCINEDYIEKYIRGILPKSKGNLTKLEEYASSNHIPIIQKEVVQLLKVILGISNPRNILEIGTAIGYSALVMASSTHDNCAITTIERRRDMIELALKNIYDTRYRNRINILHGDAVEVLPKINKMFDFIFLDASKGHYLEFFIECMNLLENGGLIVSDNVLFRGMVACDDLVVRRKKTIVKRLREYLNYINNLEGYETCIVPIGDGLALTYKKE